MGQVAMGVFHKSPAELECGDTEENADAFSGVYKVFAAPTGV